MSQPGGPAGRIDTDGAVYPVTVEIYCDTGCQFRTCHGPFGVDRAKFRYSTVLTRAAQGRIWDRWVEKKRVYVIDSPGPTFYVNYPRYAFTCQTLRFLFDCWKVDRCVDLRFCQSVDDLANLSKALWYFECSPEIFSRMAENIRSIFADRDYANGTNASQWALISVVFGWPEEFKKFSMDLSLFDRAKWNPESMPVAEDPGPYLVNDGLVKSILSRKHYETQCSEAYTFVHYEYTRYTRLAKSTSKPVRSFAAQLHQVFLQKGFEISEEFDSDQNQLYFKKVSAAEILRQYSSILGRNLNKQSQPPKPTRESRKLVSGRFSTGTKPFIMRIMESGDNMAPLEESGNKLADFHSQNRTNTKLWRRSIMERFDQKHRHNLVSQIERNGASPNLSTLVELPAGNDGYGEDQAQTDIMEVKFGSIKYS
ncbi:hypothetical protein GQ44DRAFT_774616 [Phaeosphaeriaceae sp. PMI808]|nr:hypothetical protein GQ44DRAFT_774616 [Phaeosphaeriaceae sp. PMI808]